jgi:acyl dehydratase
VPPFSALSPGDRFAGPRQTITETMLTTVTALTGYVHPLFTDHEYVRERSPFAAPPAPGALLLLLLGGLAERSEAFDEHTVALLGFDDVRFLRAASVGDTVSSHFEVIDTEPRSDPAKGGIVRWRWCAEIDGEVVCEATARMLTR